MERVLITGGAGFVGSHLAQEMVEAGYEVRILDNFEPQVHHDPAAEMPASLRRAVEIVQGDVRDLETVKRALSGVDSVIHFAATVGVGQSMYEIDRYTDINVQGTARLLQAVLDVRRGSVHVPLQRLVVASSMSMYGEGRYHCPACGPMLAQQRSLAQLQRHEWEVACPRCGAPLTPEPTDEAKPADLTSIYALTKYTQEEMVLIFGRAYGIPSVALRFFNIYGPRQALSNPYTGVCAIFAARLLAGERPQVFEDGRQMRDFVSIHDIARACRAAVERRDVTGRAFNIASGRPISIGELARALAAAMELPVEPEMTARFRMGDIRHCIADIAAARAQLGYQPQVRLEDGLRELADWLREQAGRATPDKQKLAQATVELARYGLTG